jgi:hypothetical protein
MPDQRQARLSLLGAGNSALPPLHDKAPSYARDEALRVSIRGSHRRVARALTDARGSCYLVTRYDAMS